MKYTTIYIFLKGDFMKTYVTSNSLYFVGSFKDILKELKKISKEYLTVKEAIKNYLN